MHREIRTERAHACTGEAGEEGNSNRYNVKGERLTN